MTLDSHRDNYRMGQGLKQILLLTQLHENGMARTVEIYLLAQMTAFAREEKNCFVVAMEFGRELLER